MVIRPVINMIRKMDNIGLIRLFLGSSDECLWFGFQKLIFQTKKKRLNRNTGLAQLNRMRSLGQHNNEVNLTRSSKYGIIRRGQETNAPNLNLSTKSGSGSRNIPVK